MACQLGKDCFLPEENWARDSQSIHTFQILKGMVFKVRTKIKIGKRHCKAETDNLPKKNILIQLFWKCA